MPQRPVSAAASRRLTDPCHGRQVPELPCSPGPGPRHGNRVWRRERAWDSEPEAAGLGDFPTVRLGQSDRAEKAEGRQVEG